MTRCKRVWAPPTSGWASWVWRTNCCARRSLGWRVACLFTGRGRASERRDLACYGALVRRASGLPSMGAAALVILSRGKPQHGVPAGTARSGATGRGGELASGDQSRSRELTVPRRGAPEGLGPAALDEKKICALPHRGPPRAGPRRRSTDRVEC